MFSMKPPLALLSDKNMVRVAVYDEKIATWKFQGTYMYTISWINVALVVSSPSGSGKQFFYFANPLLHVGFVSNPYYVLYTCTCSSMLIRQQ